MCKRSLVKVVHIKNDNFTFKEKLCVCIGYFDGIHLGHKALIDTTVDYAHNNSLKSALISFEPDPIEVITKKKNYHIFSSKKRKEIISSLGIDYLIIIDFNEELMRMNPEEFIDKYLKKLNIQHLVCGYDFRFAYKAKGNPNLLRKYFKTDIIPEYKYYGKKVSSSRIKDTIYKGNFKLVNRLLGFNYEINLKVKKVQKMASKWLLEAKIADKDIFIPKEGEYKGYFSIKNDTFYLESSDKHSINDTVTIVFYE